MSDELSRVFAALADPTRRDIVARLTVADATVTEIAEPYAVSLQAVSKHLKVLEDAGLVSRTRDGQRRPVHLEAQVLEIATKWIERYQRRTEERYRRLDGVLDELSERASAPTGSPAPIPRHQDTRPFDTTGHPTTRSSADHENTRQENAS